MSLKRIWTIPIDIELRDSWNEDVAEEKPSKPPRIRGWIGILKEGSTRQSGLALIWRKKVVVGAGSMAQGDEDSYRPLSLFGATTTFTFQRLIGEIDVSELKVTTFKDQIDWRPGQEADFQSLLKKAVESGEEPLARMARNYRSTLKTKPVQETVEKSIEETMQAVASALKNEIDLNSTNLQVKESTTVDLRNAEGTVSREIPIKGVEGSKLIFQITVQPGDMQLIRIGNSGKDWMVSLNRAHPFMNSFANLPGADLDPILRITMGLALAEITANNSGHDFPDFIRIKLNEFLTTQLSNRMET